MPERDIDELSGCRLEIYVRTILGRNDRIEAENSRLRAIAEVAALEAKCNKLREVMKRIRAVTLEPWGDIHHAVLKMDGLARKALEESK